MATYEQAFSKLNEDERKELDRFIVAVSNDLSRKILVKLTSPHSPISAEDLPLKELGGSKVASLYWLDYLEQMNIVNSGLVQKGTMYNREYDITDIGKAIVQKYKIFL